MKQAALILGLLVTCATVSTAQSRFEIVELTEVSLNDSYAFSDTLAWVVGDDGQVFKWEGVEWTAQETGTELNLYSIYFLNRNEGFVAGGAYGQVGVILRTDDGGASWFESSLSPSAGDPLFSIAFSSDSIGSAFGAMGLAYRTEDRGRTWSLQSVGTEETLLSSVFPAASGGQWVDGDTTSGIGWTVGANGFIAFTADFGETWETQTSGIETAITSVAAWNPINPIAVGTGGIILRSFDRGQTWEESPSGTLNDLTDISDETEFVYDSLDQPIARAAFITGLGGTLLLTDIAGAGGFRDYSPLSAGPDFTSFSGWGGGFSSTGGGHALGRNGANSRLAERITHFITAADGRVLMLYRDVGALVSVEQDVPSQRSSRIAAVYPNPFRSRTQIVFTVDRPGRVVLTVYDMLGRIVTNLADGWQPAGSHSVWFDARALPPGVYVCRIQAPGADSTAILIHS